MSEKIVKKARSKRPMLSANIEAVQGTVREVEQTGHQERQLETEAIVEVSTALDGERSISFSFQTSEQFADEWEKKKASRAQAVEEEAREKFRRREVSEDETLAAFRNLGSELFNVAIGFLKVIPELTDRNFVYVKHEVATSVSQFASTVAKSKTTVVDEMGSSTDRFLVTLEDLPIILRKMGRSMETIQAANTLAKSSLGALVSDYEAFISNLLRAISGLRQGVLISDADTIQVGSLSNFSTFDEVIDDLIDDKIQDILQSKTHVQVLKWIEEKCGVNLTSDRVLLREFVEVCQRRNLLVHAGGRVNKRYRRICIEEGWKPEDLGKIGESVEVSRRYLRRATARIFIVGFLSLHIVWQKLLPRKRQESLEQLLSISHDFVDLGLTKMCRRICEFALGSDKEMSAKLKAYFSINLAQSYLFDPDLSDEEKSVHVERVINCNDFSMAPPVVQLALSCLRREFEKLPDCLEKAISDGLTYSQAVTWSVFREVRSQAWFLEKIRAVREA